MFRFISGNWFLCAKFVQLAIGGKRYNTVSTSKKECNKLDLTVAQYFWLVDHNDWSSWFAILVTLLFLGLLKKEPAKLRHLILLSRVTYWAPGGDAVRCQSTGQQDLTILYSNQFFMHDKDVLWDPSRIFDTLHLAWGTCDSTSNSGRVWKQ